MYPLYHFCLVISVIILIWALLPSRKKSYKNGTRSLGRMENTLHSIYNTCGALNNCAHCQVETTLSEDALLKSLLNLQQRHAIIQTTIETAGVSYPEFRFLRQITGIPLLVERRSTPNEWMKVIQRELNTTFEPSLPLVRCTILQPVEGEGASDIILTARSDLVDVKSIVFLLSELIEIYTAIQQPENRIHNELKSKTESIPPPVDHLLPSYPTPWLFVSHCYGLLKRHAFRLPDNLPHTSLPTPVSSRKFGWTTHLIIRSLAPEVTLPLIAQARKKIISLESLCYVAMMLAIARTIYQYQEAEDIRLWGILVKDIRGTDKKTRPNVGVLFSLLDFVCSFSSRDCNGDFDFLWTLAQRITREIQTAIASGTHLSSMVFTEYISYITSLYSKYFTTPRLCPSFGLHFLGDIDRDGDMEPSFYPLRATSEPSVKSLTAANCSTTSFPLPVVTCYIHNHKLCANLSYSSETSSSAAMNRLMDEFTSILTSL